MVLLDTLPGFLLWGSCGMLGPLPLYSGFLFPNSVVPSGGSFQSCYIYVALIASTFRLGKLSFAAVHIALHLFVRPRIKSFLFFSHHLVCQLYTSLWENNLICLLFIPTKASVARNKSAVSLLISGSGTPGNRHRVECLKVLVFVLNSRLYHLVFYSKA